MSKRFPVAMTKGIGSCLPGGICELTKGDSCALTVLPTLSLDRLARTHGKKLWVLCLEFAAIP